MTTNQTPPEQTGDDGGAAHLRRFLFWMRVLTFGFGVTQTGTAIIYGDLPTAATAVITLGLCGLATLASRWNDQGRTHAAALLTGVGMLGLALSEVMFVPAFAPVLAMTPLGAFALVAPFVSRESLRRFAMLCWITTLAVVLLAEIAPAMSLLPALPVAIIHTAALIGLFSLVLLLLGQHTQRMATLLVESRAALALARDPQAQLIQAGKLAAVGTLAAGVAHELNNPLMVIRGQAQMALDRPTDERQRRAWERVERQTDKMMQVIEHLRVFGRKSQPAEREIVSLETVAHESLLLIGTQLADRDIILTLQVSQPAPRVEANATEIEQIVLNLLVNARDALTPGGGEITLSTWLDELGCHLTVADTGPGIPNTMLERVFDPFFTTKEAGKGTGLGLSISQDIARKWGGDLTLANRVDRPGALATLTLPATPVMASQPLTVVAAS